MRRRKPDEGAGERPEDVERKTPSTFWIALADVVETILDRFGWPGALLLYGIYFIEWHATDEQKRAIVDQYVLGKGLTLAPLLWLGLAFVAAFLAQSHLYRRKLRLMKEELKRLGKWKTEQQEKQIGAPLHHSESEDN